MVQRNAQSVHCAAGETVDCAASKTAGWQNFGAREFSAVSTAAIAIKDAFCSIFQDLHDLHSSTALQTQFLQFFASFRIVCDFFCKILLNFS